MLLNLKLCILQSGIRQNQLAQAVGIDESLLSKIINGFRESNSEQRKRIAHFLGKDEGWLFRRYDLEKLGTEQFVRSQVDSA
jgi:transcriptional regulator with XRE-family HTH domain